MYSSTAIVLRFESPPVAFSYFVLTPGGVACIRVPLLYFDLKAPRWRLGTSSAPPGGAVCIGVLLLCFILRPSGGV